MLERELQRAPRASFRGAFFKGWLRDPFHVASVVPSGKGTAKLMTADIGPGCRVVELGPGTGALTEEILERGVHPRDLYLIELSGTFVEILRGRFPDVTVIQADAESLVEHLGALSGSVDCIVSAVPILWFKASTKREIVRQAFELLAPEGCFHQVTFFGRPPVSGRQLERLELKSRLLGIALLNFPPAFVYRIERAQPPRSSSRDL